MAEPRIVRVKHLHGKSVGFSLGGVMRRLRKGDVGVVPYEIWERHKHKLERLDGGAPVQEPTRLSNAVERLAAARASNAQMQREDAEVKEAPLWKFQIPPERYLEIYADKEAHPNPSAKVLRNIELARRCLA